MSDGERADENPRQLDRKSARVFQVFLLLFAVAIFGAAYFLGTGATTTGYTLLICAAAISVGGFRYLRRKSRERR